MLGREFCLLGLILFGHFLGVAAGRLRVLEFLVFDGEEFRTERLDLFFGGGAHVGGGDDRAETSRGRDRLQARQRRRPSRTPWRPGIVPAAVIIIGKARPKDSAASITAR